MSKQDVLGVVLETIQDLTRRLDESFNNYYLDERDLSLYRSELKTKLNKAYIFKKQYLGSN